MQPGDHQHSAGLALLEVLERITAGSALRLRLQPFRPRTRSRAAIAVRRHSRCRLLTDGGDRLHRLGGWRRGLLRCGRRAVVRNRFGSSRRLHPGVLCAGLSGSRVPLAGDTRTARRPCTVHERGGCGRRNARPFPTVTSVIHRAVHLFQKHSDLLDVLDLTTHARSPT